MVRAFLFLFVAQSYPQAPDKTNFYKAKEEKNREFSYLKKTSKTKGVGEIKKMKCEPYLP